MNTTTPKPNLSHETQSSPLSPQSSGLSSQSSVLSPQSSSLSPQSSVLSPQSSIFIAGHRGMVGSAIIRRLQKDGCKNIITRSHAELDLLDQAAVKDFFENEKIDYVVLAAAKVGGIHANNTYPAEFIYQNLMIQCNIVHQAYKAGIENLLFLGSSCIYPKYAPQPMKEDHLLTGILEPTNEPYAVAKIAGIKICESYNRQYGTKYRAVMPTNLYGPGDNFHLENSHVLPALIRKFHLAKMAMDGDIKAIQKDEKAYGAIPAYIRGMLGVVGEGSTTAFMGNGKDVKVEVWGSGKALREFLHVDDMADASVFVMGLEQEKYSSMGNSFFNIGTGKDITITEVANLIKEVVGFNGEIVFNADQPDGTPRKLLDTSMINNLGWEPRYTLKDGLQNAYEWYKSGV